MNRREFLQTSTATAATAAVTIPLASAHGAHSKSGQKGTGFTRKTKELEWRNKQPGMEYRRLGATGLMVSEMVLGGIPLTRENPEMIDLALEKGVNYIDTATAYGRDSESEKAIGKYFKENPGSREKVFLATKLSPFAGVRRRMYQEHYDELPQDKKDLILSRAKEIAWDRSVSKPGIFFRYYPGHERELDWDYRIIAMQQELGTKIESRGEFRKFMYETLEASMQRTGVDYYDIVFCPHGCASVEGMLEPEMLETLDEMKKKGLFRFAAVSTHTAYDQVTEAAADTPTYDLVMATYNVINHNGMDRILADANAKGLGFVAMKAAASVRTHFDDFKPLPEWREQKLQALVAGDQSAPVKAYQFVLNNPNVSAVITNSWNTDMLAENVTSVGGKIEPNMV